MSQNDLLGPLVAAIETVRGRIDGGYRQVLVAQEAQTRVSLIDPILIALGWDVANPAYVRSEFSADEDRRADYALLADARPKDEKQSVVVSIEAKRLDTNLDTRKNRDQMTLQVNDNGATHAILTDGNIWNVYDFRPTGQSVPERLRLTVNLSKDEPYDSAFKLLMLWRSNMASSAPTTAQEPIVGTRAERQDESPSTPSETPLAEPPSAEWTPLEEVTPTQNNRPSRIMLPDGTEKEISSWARVGVMLFEWLYAKGRFSVDDLPFKARGGATIVDSTKKTRTFEPVGEPPIFVERHGNGTTQASRWRFIAGKFDEIDLNSIYVKVPN